MHTILSRHLNVSPAAILKQSIAAAIFLVLLLPLHAAGQTDRDGIPSADSPDHGAQRPQRRIPPPAAQQACEGKAEGDKCSFHGRNGILTGECLSGREQVFACRPYHSRKAGEVPEAGETPAQQSPGTFPDGKIETRQAPATVPDSHVNPSGSEAASGLQETGPPGTAASLPQSAVTRSSGIPDGYGELLSRYAGSALSYIVIALISAGIAWWGFYRYTTRPLRRLRSVTQQLAGGDLSARVGEGLLHRKSEVVELGRDIDRMAERIESLVGSHKRLIRDVSHELRSPLARLNVALELARQSAGPEHAAPFDRIERESDRLNDLIGQLLMLTKLDSAGGVVKKTDIDLQALIDEIAMDTDFEARNNRRRVTAKPGAPLRIQGNQELLRQALENIVRNAVRYTDEESEVEISLSKRLTGAGWAHIEVRDHGPGIPESELVNVFRPFYRVNDARERQSGGAGVGLAIADRAVRLHNGRLQASNAPDGGLTMEIELPLM